MVQKAQLNAPKAAPKAGNALPPKPAPPPERPFAGGNFYAVSDNGAFGMSLGKDNFNFRIQNGKVEVSTPPDQEGQKTAWRELSPSEQEGFATALRRESTDDHAGTAINTQPFLDALPKSAGWTAGGSVKVKRGDNLTGIAGQVGRPLKELEQANPTLARGHDF